MSRRLHPQIVVMVGMPRGGSTTLYHQLQQHPGAALPFRKETFYFSFHHARGESWFLDLYRSARPGQVGFDISPDYFYDPRAIERILRFDPATKAILSVREPVSWALSLYTQRAGTVPHMPPFERFVHDHEIRVGDSSVRFQLSKGLVTRMVDLCREAFGQRLLIYDFDLFSRDPLYVVRAIECFTGLSPHFTVGNFRNVRLNASNRRHNRRLFALLNDERFISLLHAFLPDRLLAFLRRRYYLAAARPTPPEGDMRHLDKDRRLAEEVFGADRETVRSLFDEGPMLLGSGETYSPD